MLFYLMLLIILNDVTAQKAREQLEYCDFPFRRYYSKFVQFQPCCLRNYTYETIWSQSGGERVLKLDCRSRNFQNVAVGRMEITNAENIKSLTFEQAHIHGSINKIKVHMLENLPQLKEFVLSMTSLKSLDGNFFGANVNLEVINLSWNRLSSLDPMLLSRNTKLRKIVLTGNGRISSIPENFFKYNTDLREVLLNRNSLKSLNGNIFKYNPLIEKVDFSDNPTVRFISFDIFKPNVHTKLGSVDLQHLGSEIIPSLKKLYYQDPEIGCPVFNPQYLFRFNRKKFCMDISLLYGNLLTNYETYCSMRHEECMNRPT